MAQFMRRDCWPLLKYHAERPYTNSVYHQSKTGRKNSIRPNWNGNDSEEFIVELGNLNASHSRNRCGQSG